MRMKVVYVDKSVLFSCIELDEKGGKKSALNMILGVVLSVVTFFFLVFT